jgi:SAM-dependent methyltransferase
MKSENKQLDTLIDNLCYGDKPTKTGMRFVKTLAERIFRYAGLSDGQSVLEIGPGRGVFADICLEKGIEYFAIEPSEPMAISLEQRGAKVVRAMIPPLPTLDQQFDAVVMINVMEHMDSLSEVMQVSKQVCSVLKPGGRFVVHSPDYLNWRLNFFNCDSSHNYVTSRRRLKQVFLNSGFENIKSCYMSGPTAGFLCFVLSAIASHLPFALLNGVFTENRLCYKLYKIQLTFLRKVLILGEKRG